MRSGNLLFSAVQFLFVLATLAAGAFLVALPMAPWVRFKIAVFFTDSPELFRPVGVLVLVLGGILGAGFYAMYKKRFFRVLMSPHPRVELALIKSVVQRYCTQAYEGRCSAIDVLLHPDKKLEIVFEMEALSQEAEKELLEKTERDLGGILAKQIGYDREFFLTVVLR